MNDQIVSKYELEVQIQIDIFKAKMRKISEEVLGQIYCDCMNYADTDAHINYHNYLKDHFRESLIKEITEGYQHYSWAHGIRMELLAKYPKEISNKIITDLQGKIKSLEEHIEQLRRFR